MHALHVIDHRGFLPDFMKEAGIPAIPEGLNPAAFADLQRKYPLHTKEACYASLATAMMDQDTDGGTIGRLLEAAEMHGIAAEAERVRSEFLDIRKSAGTIAANNSLNGRGEECALILDHGGDDKRRYYPIGNIVETEKSARGMAQDYTEGRLPVDVLRGAALELMKAANAQGLEPAAIPYRIRVLGTENMPNFEKAARLTELRIHTRKMAAETADLYRDIVSSAEADQANLPQFVDLYRELDERCGLMKYSSACPDPYEVFYGGLPLDQVEKLAHTVVLIKDVMVPRDVFATLPEDTIKRQFRKEAADRIIAARALPAPEASQSLSECAPEESAALLRLLAALA